jgi:hypothetical protein
MHRRLVLVVLVVLMAVAACAPTTQLEQGQSLALDAQPDTIISAVALIAPRLQPPTGHAALVITSLTNSAVTIEGEDATVATMNAVNRAVAQVTPVPSDSIGRFFRTLSATLPPPSGKYRVHVRLVPRQGGGPTVVTVGSDTAYGSWLVTELTAGLERHFGR